MTGRRSKRLETVSSPLTLLAEIRSARAALLRASGTVRIAGPTYLALGEAVDAMSALAAHLGHPEYFLEEMNRTP